MTTWQSHWSHWQSHWQSHWHSNWPMRVVIALSLAILLAALSVVPAAAQESTGDVGSAVTTFGLGDWLSLMARLALVIGVIWAAVVAMRWYVRRMQGGGSRGALGALEVLETHALGPNRALHLVRLGERAVLIGATQERITQLLTLDDPEELQRLTERPEDEARPLRGRSGPSVLTSLGTGLLAMRAQHRAQRDALRAQRDAARVTTAGDASSAAPAAAERAARASWFGALRAAFPRAQTARPLAEEATTPVPAAERRQSLFERTLASIDAVEVTSGPRATDGLRARAGYGRASSAAGTTAGRTDTAPSMAAGRSRDAQLADLQRAIAAARKQAG